MRKGSHTTLVGVLGALALLLCAVPAPAGQQTSIVGTDDWPADSILDPGTVSCPGGEVVWVSPVEPVCPASGRIHLRGALGYSCFQAADAGGQPQPLLTGTALFRLNANFDAEYSGAVRGEWWLVPGADCSLETLTDPEVYWRGTWRGQRTLVCDGGQCQWIGALKFVGRGHGGDLEGLHFKGTETIVTFTPLPAPYELLGICPAAGPCPPEGQLAGHVWGW